MLPGCALLLMLTNCSSTGPTTETKGPEKAADPVTGESALYRAYQVARTWAPDALVLKLTNMHLNEVPEVRGGKAGAWEATFVSATRSQSRPYTYSIVEVQPNLHKGVFAGLEESWGGPQGLTAPFLIAAVKVDTDAAYKTALEKGAEYDKKNPGKPITFLLEKVQKYPDPAWRVIWGESVGTSSFSVFVDATTGAYLETMH
jgi:hypothetical protein